MHTHLLSGVPPGCPEVTFPLTVAHGVTGVREVGLFLDLLFAWREEVESGRIVGPRIVGSGPLIDGVPPVYPGIATVARTPTQARQTVDILSRRGADFVKAYEMLRRDTFFASWSRRRRTGLRWSLTCRLRFSPARRRMRA
jgi:hypothetical protein